MPDLEDAISELFKTRDAREITNYFRVLERLPGFDPEKGKYTQKQWKEFVDINEDFFIDSNGFTLPSNRWNLDIALKLHYALPSIMADSEKEKLTEDNFELTYGISVETMEERRAQLVLAAELNHLSDSHLTRFIAEEEAKRLDIAGFETNPVERIRDIVELKMLLGADDPLYKKIAGDRQSWTIRSAITDYITERSPEANSVDKLTSIFEINQDVADFMKYAAATATKESVRDDALAYSNSLRRRSDRKQPQAERENIELFRLRDPSFIFNYTAGGLKMPKRTHERMIEKGSAENRYGIRLFELIHYITNHGNETAAIELYKQIATEFQDEGVQNYFIRQMKSAFNVELEPIRIQPLEETTPKTQKEVAEIDTGSLEQTIAIAQHALNDASTFVAKYSAIEGVVNPINDRYREIRKDINDQVDLARLAIEIAQTGDGISTKEIQEQNTNLTRSLKRIDHLVLSAQPSQYSQSDVILTLKAFGAKPRVEHPIKDDLKELVQAYITFGEKHNFSVSDPQYENGGTQAKIRISGNHAYTLLEKEQGVHRFTGPYANKRYSEGISVQVMPDIEQPVAEIDPHKLKTDEYGGSTSGGQAANTGNTNIRLRYFYKPDEEPITVVALGPDKPRNETDARLELQLRLHERISEEHAGLLRQLGRVPHDQVRSYDRTNSVVNERGQYEVSTPLDTFMAGGISSHIFSKVGLSYKKLQE